MDTKLIPVICFGVLSLFLCIFSALFTKTEKVKTYIAIKGLASFSYVLLALVCTNLIFSMFAYSLFILVGLIAFLFSTVVRAIPTKSDMFHAFYTIVESIGFASLTTSVFFLIEQPFFGLIGAGVGFLVMLVIYLVLKKGHAKKDKLSNLLLFFTSLIFMGVSVNLAVLSLTAQSFLFAGGAILAFVYVVIQTFTTFTNKKCNITKNIFLGTALICLALAIFFI